MKNARNSLLAALASPPGVWQAAGRVRFLAVGGPEKAAESSLSRTSIKEHRACS